MPRNIFVSYSEHLLNLMMASEQAETCRSINNIITDNELVVFLTSLHCIFPMTPPEIEPATFRLIAQCLKQLLHIKQPINVAVCYNSKLFCDGWSLNHSYREHTYANARTCSVLLAVRRSCGDRRHLQEFCVQRCLLVSPFRTPFFSPNTPTHLPLFYLECRNSCFSPCTFYSKALLPRQPCSATNNSSTQRTTGYSGSVQTQQRCRN